MKRRLGGLVLVSLLAASCAAPPGGQVPATGTLTLSLAGLFPGDRQVQVVPSGTHARVTVTGPGLAEPLIVSAPIHGTSMMATLRGIPAGPNRVIALEALDDAGAPLPGGRFRTTATLQAGANTAEISPITTPRGDVFAQLLANGSSLAETLDAQRVQGKLEAIQRAQRVAHFALVDGKAVAQELAANGGNLDALVPTDSRFVQAPVTLRVTVTGLPRNLAAEVWVDDPVSAKQSVAENGNLDVNPIKPGTWRLYGRAGTLRVGPMELDLASDRSVTLDFATGRTLVTPMPHGRGGAASAVLKLNGQDQLIVAGGIASEGPGLLPQATRSALAFDGQAWQTLPAQMDTPVSHAAVATRDDQLWVLGGITQAGQLTNLVQVFDASEGTWSTRNWTLPFPCSHASAGFFEDDLIVTAGLENWAEGISPNWSVYRIDSQAGVWGFTEANLSYARVGAATAIADGKLFVFSGTDKYGDLIHSAEVVDPQKETAYGVAPIPTPRFGASTWVSGGKIFVLGGVSAVGKALDSIEAYDIALNRWEVHAPLRTPRGYMAAGFLNGAFIAAGGHDGFPGSVVDSVVPFAVVESLAQ